ncbi:SAM-dependent methyltransferase [Saccharothrix syringae]|uniref:Class I SAM-dependent methyltransferase n=1 Tax=Saccharothrix syringae TaxID=103733 RepID=A0A5Q0GYY8_SACSY|nr:methyltransferase domain-containing protein [Saccharothrix syringae]QFZ19256.1 class I SAM-dependent methyltransferase [Saccharothrix syringae]
MERIQLSALAHADHPIAAPVGEGTAQRLLHHAIRRPDAHVLDLGCGEGAWLLRALEANPGVTAVGVDVSDEGFDRTRELAARAGVADRLELRRQDVAAYESPRPADVVLSIGAAYAFGGLAPTLAAARRHLAEDGVLVLGDCFWEREPDPAVRAEMESGPQRYADLPTTVSHVVDDGWTPVHGHVSTLAEWDEYEWSWVGSLNRWALDHPGHPDRDQALRRAAAHRETWLGGYRGVLGFVLLVLRPTPAAPAPAGSGPAAPPPAGPTVSRA